MSIANKVPKTQPLLGCSIATKKQLKSQPKLKSIVTQISHPSNQGSENLSSSRYHSVFSSHIAQTNQSTTQTQ
jgi:hypothetical protein